MGLEGLQGKGSNPIKSLVLILSMAEDWDCCIPAVPALILGCLSQHSSSSSGTEGRVQL